MKKIKLASLLFILSFSASAAVSKGEIISAKKFNEATFGVGDIKQSLLTESQFQSQFGNCWVKMTGQSVAGSDYETITGNSTLPNSAGRFLRDIGGDAPSLGQVQDDALQNITGRFYPRVREGSFTGDHTELTEGAFGRTVGQLRNYAQANSTSISTLLEGVNFDASRVVRTADETRPKNVGINLFVKINHNCN